MNRLWILMAEMFHHKWTSTMGEVPNKTWREACQQFGESEWRNAITMTATYHHRSKVNEN
jgi:hypothetical protein